MSPDFEKTSVLPSNLSQTRNLHQLKLDSAATSGWRKPHRNIPFPAIRLLLVNIVSRPGNGTHLGKTLTLHHITVYSEMNCTVKTR